MQIISKEKIKEENDKRLAFVNAESNVIKKILDLNLSYSDALNNDEVKALVLEADEKAAIVNFSDWKNDLEKKVEAAKEQKAKKKKAK